MYWLMSIGVLLRILAATGFLFVAVPAMACAPRAGTSRTERLFWNLGVGIAALTLAGQILTLANLFSPPTLLLLAVATVILGRAYRRGVTPAAYVKAAADATFLAVLDVFDGRSSVRLRLRTLGQRLVSRRTAEAPSRDARFRFAGWLALIAIAAAFRLYRPFASANLGFSDTYVHLYLLELLEEGRQVDPEWGPYPRGLQFVLLAIQHLTNAEPILLMNFFGAVVGVTITVAVAETARRVSGSLTAALLAGLMFATLAGGPGQYFIIGGAFSTTDAGMARALEQAPYAQLASNRGSFDLALTDFQRQTSTLSQELAIALLFPTALFLFAFLRTGDRWRLAGFAGGTAAIAGIHSGVLVPLVLMSALAVPVVAIERKLDLPKFRNAVLAGLVSIIAGSAWAAAFFAYPYAGGKSHGSMDTSVATAVFYYFPFLRRFAPHAPAAAETGSLYVSFTPFLLVAAALAALWALLWIRRSNGAGRVWMAAVFLAFLLIHFSSRLAIPQIIEIARNSQWLLMALCAVAGILAADVASVIRKSISGTGSPTARRAAVAVVVAPLLLLWASRVPRLGDPLIRDQIVDYSGYGGAALSVLEITRRHEPYTWTLISYGQEFPMVLGRGFHIPASTFLARYDPSEPVVPIPTPLVFVIVEKNPHPFQINTWAESFTRTDLETRLQTWVHAYQMTHRNVRVFFEDDDVRVYRIERSAAEMKMAIPRAGGGS